MKKAYVTPEVIVHGTVEDMTQGALLCNMHNFAKYHPNKCGGNGGGDGSW
jgi:hypothetical protein